MNILGETTLDAGALGIIKTRVDELIAAQVGNQTYAEGKIYKLTCRGEPRILYCGSTCATLNTRLQGHRNSAAHEPQSPLYRFMADMGAEEFEISLIEHYPCRSRRELEAKEYDWIRELRPALNVNGLSYQLPASASTRASAPSRANPQDQRHWTKTLGACGISAHYDTTREINIEQLHSHASPPTVQQLNESFRYIFDNRYCHASSNSERRARVYSAIVTNTTYEAIFQHMYAEGSGRSGDFEHPLMSRMRTAPSVLESIKKLLPLLCLSSTHDESVVMHDRIMENVPAIASCLDDLECTFAPRRGDVKPPTDFASWSELAKHEYIGHIKSRLNGVFRNWNGLHFTLAKKYNRTVQKKRVRYYDYKLEPKSGILGDIVHVLHTL